VARYKVDDVLSVTKMTYEEVEMIADGEWRVFRRYCETCWFAIYGGEECDVQDENSLEEAYQKFIAENRK